MLTKDCIQPGCYTNAVNGSSRCRAHRRVTVGQRRGQREYGLSSYRRQRRAVLEAEPWCHRSGGCPYPDAGSLANPLTADHLIPVALGGAGGELTVLCKRCNAAKRDERRGRGGG